jgi:predicted metal-binding membrane protein
MTETPLAAALRRDRGIVLAALAAVVAIAWAYLLLGAGIEQPMMNMGSGQMMAMPHDWSLGYAAIILVMWAVMMVAMMLPSAAPVILLVGALDRQRGAGPSRSAAFAAGYLLVWFGFSLAATGLQWGIDMAGLLSERMATANLILAGGVLVGAGIYQWTPLKQTCLTRCRSPFDLVIRYSRSGASIAVLVGMRHGLFCLGCCWMLMALLFVGGLMNLAWIAAIALFVLVEKTLPWGGRVGRIAGIALAAWGAATLAAAL